MIASFQARAGDLGYADQCQGVRVTPGDPKELVEKPEQLDAAFDGPLVVAVTAATNAALKKIAR